MIVEQGLLEPARIEFSVFPKLQRDLREPFRLLARVQSVHVGLGLLRPGDGVGHGRQDEEVAGDEDCEDRHARDVAHPAHPPGGAISPHERVEREAKKPECEDDQDAEEDDALVGVVQDVVPHLVPHHGLDLRQRAALEQVVVQSDALRAEKSADVGRDARRLPRGVRDEDVLRRNAVGASEREDRSADGLVGQPRVFVEEREDEDGRDQEGERDEQSRGERSPDPPGPRRPTQHAVEKNDRQAAQEDRERELLETVAHPGPERLCGQAVLVLAEETLVDRQRKDEDRRHDDVLCPVEKCLHRSAFRPPLRPVAHLRRPSEREQQPRDPDSVEESPEMQPVPALEVGVRARLLLRRHLRQIGPRRRHRVHLLPPGDACAPKAGAPPRS